MFERQLHPALVESLPTRLSTMKAGCCWLWLGAQTGKEYGKWQIEGIEYRAHRVVYTLLVGDIPDGLNLLHSCDTRLCCNPEHLSPGTQTQNMADMYAKGRGAGQFSPGDCVGSKNNAAKLTPAQAAAIRNDTRTLVVIAAEYGISQSNVSKIRTGKGWKNV